MECSWCTEQVITKRPYSEMGIVPARADGRGRVGNWLAWRITRVCWRPQHRHLA